MTTRLESLNKFLTSAKMDPMSKEEYMQANKRINAKLALAEIVKQLDRLEDGLIPGPDARVQPDDVEALRGVISALAQINERIDQRAARLRGGRGPGT